jgi:hypothetical protein
MKSHSLQNLVQQIFSDENTKHQFVADPESVISKYPLSKHEKKAVLNTHARLGLITSDSSQLEQAVRPFTWWI